MTVEFSARALKDLHDIAAYFDLIGFSAGDRIVSQIEARCRSLATYPREARVCGPRLHANSGGCWRPLT
ncbi:MAG TPA: type II toxin-antitoxin system RelE/ParE family toxin [Microvirga sp.]|nr:type II toxin-antitoxin system RelE/ParE family toxin [Microvirga sp.]